MPHEAGATFASEACLRSPMPSRSGRSTLARSFGLPPSSICSLAIQSRVDTCLPVGEQHACGVGRAADPDQALPIASVGAFTRARVADARERQTQCLSSLAHRRPAGSFFPRNFPCARSCFDVHDRQGFVSLISSDIPSRRDFVPVAVRAKGSPSPCANGRFT